MSENEAKSKIAIVGGCRGSGNVFRAQIKLLEELEQYRAIGTPEELQKATKYMHLAKQNGTIKKVIDECAEYEAIGTVEECRTAMEKQKAKSPIMEEDSVIPVCPRCGEILFEVPIRRNYCKVCGQRLY